MQLWLYAAACSNAATLLLSTGHMQGDMVLRAIRFLDTLLQRDDLQKAAFLKDLAQLWPQYAPFRYLQIMHCLVDHMCLRRTATHSPCMWGSIAVTYYVLSLPFSEVLLSPYWTANAFPVTCEPVGAGVMPECCAIVCSRPCWQSAGTRPCSRWFCRLCCALLSSRKLR